MTGNHAGGQQFESALERDFMLLMEWDQTVSRITAQPVRIQISNPVAVRRSYTPDVLVEWSLPADQSRPPELVEIKYRDAFRGEWRMWRAIARAASEYAKQQGWRFRIVDETDIRTPLLDTVRFLLPFRRRPASPEAETILLEVLGMHGLSTPQRILSAAGERGIDHNLNLHALWALAARKRLCFDYSRPLTMQSPIWLGHAA